MREITQEEINAKVKAHELWRTNGDQGERAIFKNVSIIKKTFFCRNLHGVTFENIECVDTNFDNADLAFTHFRNVYVNHVNFANTNLKGSRFIRCNIVDSEYQFADLNNADFKNTTLDNVNFAYSNLYNVDFSTTNIEKICVARAVPLKVIGQKVICTQVNTSRLNNLISYWVDLGIWTTGCFQGTLEELREAVAKTHKDNPFLRARYERAINYILEEDKADKEAGKEK